MGAFALLQVGFPALTRNGLTRSTKPGVVGYWGDLVYWQIMHKHFDEKDPLLHVMEKRVEGMASFSESHGAEMPGHVAAGADSARETGIVLLLVWLFLAFLGIGPEASGVCLLSFGLGWFIWKTGRSSWLGWTRLERLHRVIEQEKYEIEHHRPQEREELVALYQAKGFEGKLLDDVVDVLMADQDRLLKVMLEEELGLTLQAYEHPLQQALGAAVGSFVAILVSIVSFYLAPIWGIPIAATLLVSGGAIVSSVYEKNRVISSVVWNVCVAVLSFGVAYFVFQFFL
ncbi:MAG: hypothetical protein K940chlam9_00215 [Chlamydiae bacterium]|nr:hypothetical protein [Chlamydiota bacterium]